MKSSTQTIKYILVAFLTTILTIAMTVFAAPFTPGQTLNPTCAPGDVDCYVDFGSGSADNFYSIDGVLTTERMVSQDGNSLTFENNNRLFGAGDSVTTPVGVLDGFFVMDSVSYPLLGPVTGDIGLVSGFLDGEPQFTIFNNYNNKVSAISLNPEPSGPTIDIYSFDTLSGNESYFSLDEDSVHISISGQSTIFNENGLVFPNLSVEPSGQNGAMYYNTTTNKMRVYENGVWVDLI